MAHQENWLLNDLFRALGFRRAHPAAEGPPAVPPMHELRAACSVLMSDIGEASLQAVASRALAAYASLDDAGKTSFFEHVLDTYSVDPEEVARRFEQWQAGQGQQQLAELFTAVEPTRQELLRRLNHASGATLQLVAMRADLLRLMRQSPALAPLDADFRHLLVSWFNRGFLRLEEIRWDSDKEIHQSLMRHEKVHPMDDRAELKRRLAPKDRRCYGFFHPATGNVPLIFVEVALVREIPDRIDPVLDPGPTVPPSRASTAVLYSINNALEGLGGISFGNFLIKQVIERVQRELPHLEQFVTLSPIPGFRRWLENQGAEHADLRRDLEQLETLAAEPSEAAGPSESAAPGEAAGPGETAELSGPAGSEETAGSHAAAEPSEAGASADGADMQHEDRIAEVRERLMPVLAQYIALEKRADGKPVDAVARFHLGNGAAAWQLNWPAARSTAMARQSYGAMINYRYEPDAVEHRHEEFIRHRTVALGSALRKVLDESAGATAATAAESAVAPAHHDNTTGTDPEKDHSEMTPEDTDATASARTIYTAFLAHAERDPDRPLFALPDGRTITYGQTLHTAQRIAAKLRADGVEPGDRVAMQVQKSPEAIALYLATLQIGGVFLPLNTAYTGAEMDYFVQDATPRVLVCDPSQAGDHAHRSSAELSVETLGTSADGTLLSASDAHTGVHPVTAKDPAAILYTSGTTGRSKGAVLTHQNLAANCDALLQSWEYTADDVLIHALPIFHIHGLFVAANMTLVAGARMHWLPTFDTDAIVDLLPESTVLMGVPTFYTRLLGNDRLSAEACDSMRLFVSGSAPLLASDHVAFEERTGHAILERYGMTETGMNSTNPYRDGERRPGTVGMPLPGVEVRVVTGDDGTPTAPGDVGRVEVRGPNVFAGYWQMPEKTAAEFCEDGYFITGDLGTIDEQGYLSIVGRDKDLVISGGYNVYPKEIEEVLDEHPDVLESAVVGVPHADFGETVLAVVVPKDGAEPKIAELEAMFEGRLARFKQPRAYRVVDALPRNVMGKVQKAQLRADYADVFTAADA